MQHHLDNYRGAIAAVSGEQWWDTSGALANPRPEGDCQSSKGSRRSNRVVAAAALSALSM